MSVAIARTFSEVVGWLRHRAAEILDVTPDVIRDDEVITRYGLDSQKATRWIADLSAWLDRSVSPVAAFEYPTIVSLAKHIVEPVTRVTTSRSEPGTEVSNHSEPIAIVGLACRFPGAATPRDFWHSLSTGVHTAREVDDGRWPVNRFHSEDQNAPGRSHTRWASLLDDAQLSAFDPLFFNISPREAEEIDPQQRLFLELAWEALQDAGLRPFELHNTRTGVFAGVIWDDYGQLNDRDPASFSLHSATGKARCMVANRVSYVFGLQGPSVAIDTACSSSLCAVHLACQSLLTGDSDLVLAGGVNLLIDPVTMVGLSKFGGLSQGSKCRAFDADADGFVRGEGGGIVVLKRLSQAVADGDRIYATIRGSAMNNDGASNGLTAPNPRAQEDVLRRAWARGGIDPMLVDYIEAHGTGTMLGDPIEAKALGAVFGGENRDQAHPLRVGSVKTNIGHLEASAGIAGLIKTALALQHRLIPPSLHVDRLNPYIPFEELRLRVQTTLEPWPQRADNSPLLAGVSAFGWGGTNCHIAMQSPSITAPAGQWRLAERDAAALSASMSSWEIPGSMIGEGPERIAITADSAAEVPALLRSALEGGLAPAVARGIAVANPRIAFVCSPQGGQWRGMARTLMSEQPVFRRAVHLVHEAYAAHASWSLLGALSDDHAAWAWQRVSTIQPMIVAVQIGLAAVWRSWGISPDVYVGHSLGEITAAHLSGALDLDDTARLVIHYSRLQASTDIRGTMAMVGLGTNDLLSWGPLPPDIAIAGENSPSSVVLSGLRESLDPLLSKLQADSIFARFIDVNVAAHSVSIDPIMGELHSELLSLRPKPAHTPMISTLWAREVVGSELDAGYWPQNLRQPVRFASAIDLLAAQGVTAFVEINPHPILLPAIRQCLSHFGKPALAVESTRRSENETRVMMEGLGQLFVTGHDASSYPRYAASSAPRRAVIVEPSDVVAPASVAVPLSARSEGGLRALRDDVFARCAAQPTVSPRQLAGHCAVLDGAFSHRSVTILGAAEDPSARSAPEHAIAGDVDPTRRRKVVFVCPGQGAQWRGMARDLLATQPVFADMIRRVDRLAARYLSRSLHDELLAQEVGPWRIDVIQPLIFAIQVGLGELWRSWGIVPDAVVGHSMGEVAAIYLSGAISLEDAVKVICVRSRLLVRASGQGAMLAAELSAQAARELIGQHDQQVAIAVSNSPTSTVLSGDAGVLENIRAQLDNRGVFCRWVKVDVASHSPQMDFLLDELRQLLDGVSSEVGAVPIYSTVKGVRIDGSGLDAQYWVDNLRQTVHFGGAIQQLIADGHDLFLELSPHPILLSAVEQGFDAAGDQVSRSLGSMRREEPGVAVMLESAAHLYALGHRVFWSNVAPEVGAIALPLCPWEREEFWLPRGASVHAQSGSQAGPHPLLGRRIDNALDSDHNLWNLDLAVTAAAWLSDHKVRQSIVVSVAVTVEMILAAFAELDTGAVELRDLELAHPLVLSERGNRSIQVALRGNLLAPIQLGTLGVFSRGADESEWTSHLRGRFAPATTETATPSLAELQRSIHRPMPAADLYRTMTRMGLEFGPAFRSVVQLWQGHDEALARIELPDGVAAGSEFVAHPVLLDGSLQVVLAALGELDGTYLSVGIGRLVVLRAPLPSLLWSHARVVSRDNGAIAMVTIFDEQGVPVAIVEGLRLSRIEDSVALNASDDSDGQDVGARLRRESPGPARRLCFEGLVREQVGMVLKLAADRIDRRRPLQAMGLTSLMTIELRNRLGALIGQRLSSTLAWNYPTLDALMGYLSSLLPLSLDHDEVATPVVRDEESDTKSRKVLPQVDAREDKPLSGEGIDAQLIEELAQIERLLASV